MHTITIDDERFAVNALLRTLKKVVPDGTHEGVMHTEEFLQYIAENHVDVAFIDVDLYGTDGISLARQLSEKYPELNIIIYTGHPEYKPDALDLFVSGYLVKPVDEDDLRRALAHLRTPVRELRIQCFGYFEVFWGTDPVKFERKDSKEVFAYLIDKRGAEVSEDDLRCVLWSEDEDTAKKKNYIRNIIYDIRGTLARLGENDIIRNTRGFYSVNTARLSCDYYDYLGGREVVSARLGEYMEQYSAWSHYTKQRLFDGG